MWLPSLAPAAGSSSSSPLRDILSCRAMTMFAQDAHHGLLSSDAKYAAVAYIVERNYSVAVGSPAVSRFGSDIKL